jgi:signal transduction histidine kinase
MSQQCAPSQLTTPVESLSVQQLRAENAELQQYLEAQKKVVASLECRAGRSLQSLGVHANHLSTAFHASTHWQSALESVQHEVDTLCDLLADAMLLQKLEAGKVELKLEALTLDLLVDSVTRHLRSPHSGYAGRLMCSVAPTLPAVFADRDITEAVVLDLLARSLKYSDPDSIVILAADQVGQSIQISVTAQRFAPLGDRNFATEIVLCCRRVEVQNGKISCQQTLQGAQKVVITLGIAA